MTAPEEAERAVTAVFLGMRAYHLACAGVSLWFDRRRYRRPRLATWTLAVVGAESAWLFWRHQVRREAIDGASMRVDVAIGAVAVLACAAAVLPDEQYTSVNWAFPMNLWTAVAASAGFSRRGAAGASAALIGAYWTATGLQARRFQGEAVFNAMQYAGGWLIGDLVIRRIRQAAIQLVELHTEAVIQAARVAEEEQHVRLQRDLHERALATLGEVRVRLADNTSVARQLARAEAARLRQALRGGEPGYLRAALESAALVAEGRGVAMELVFTGPEHEPVASTVISALTTVLAIALEGCQPGDDERVVVSIETGDRLGGTEMSVRYRGPVDPIEEARLAAILSPIGGRVSLRRPSGGGMRALFTIEGTA